MKIAFNLRNSSWRKSPLPYFRQVLWDLIRGRRHHQEGLISLSKSASILLMGEFSMNMRCLWIEDIDSRDLLEPNIKAITFSIHNEIFKYHHRFANWYNRIAGFILTTISSCINKFMKSNSRNSVYVQLHVAKPKPVSRTVLSNKPHHTYTPLRFSPTRHKLS